MVAVKKMPHVTDKQKRKNFQEIRFLKYCLNARGIVQFQRAAVVHDEVRTRKYLRYLLVRCGY